MTVIKNIDQAKDLTVFTAKDDLNLDEIQEIIDVFHTDATTRNVLWDLSRIELWNLSGDDVERLAHSSSRLQNPRKNVRTAIVAPDQFTNCLAQLFTLYGESVNIPIEVRVFKNLQEAMQWITY